LIAHFDYIVSLFLACLCSGNTFGELIYEHYSSAYFGVLGSSYLTNPDPNVADITQHAFNIHLFHDYVCRARRDVRILIYFSTILV
jgi:hypothetical protein